MMDPRDELAALKREPVRTIPSDYIDVYVKPGPDPVKIQLANVNGLKVDLRKCWVFLQAINGDVTLARADRSLTPGAGFVVDPSQRQEFYIGAAHAVLSVTGSTSTTILRIHYDSDHAGTTPATPAT